ncbi:MAG: hypothetical protein RMN25_07590 [Anaerolineae bacterium]|nr:hypothetical protein [Thermoflexales bacterium]MDW8407633.1 hypothetical protein [Anaerolineae bacterium]
MSIPQIHASVATTVVLFNLILGAWGFLKYLRGEGMDGNFWGAIWLSPILGLAQALVGLVMVFMGLGVAVRAVHYLYGVLVVLSVPAAFAFTKGRDDRGAVLIYAATLLLVALFGGRAQVTVYGFGL